MDFAESNAEHLLNRKNASDSTEISMKSCDSIQNWLRMYYEICVVMSNFDRKNILSGKCRKYKIDSMIQTSSLIYKQRRPINYR